MQTLVSVGQRFFAVALVAFGVQHLVYGEFVTRAVLSWPSWIPGRALAAYAVGAGLVVAGLTILTSTRARPAALLSGALLLLSFVFLSLPLASSDCAWCGQWTSALKTLALSGGAFLAAATLPGAAHARGGHAARMVRSLEALTPAGRFFFAAFLLLAGIQHFIWADGVSRLVPAWIPGRVLWTYFAGAALIAGAVGIVIPVTKRLAGALTGLMILSWVFLVHVPLAVTYWGTRNGNETTATFEALAFSGLGFMLAGSLTRRE